MRQERQETIVGASRGQYVPSVQATAQNAVAPVLFAHADHTAGSLDRIGSAIQRLEQLNRRLGGGGSPAQGGGSPAQAGVAQLPNSPNSLGDFVLANRDHATRLADEIEELVLRLEQQA